MLTALTKKPFLFLFFIFMALVHPVFSDLSQNPHTYVCQIIDVKTYTCAPDVYSNSWRAYLECKFDNGLDLHISYEWPLETQAEDAAKRFAKCFEVGKQGNLIFKINFLKKIDLYSYSSYALDRLIYERKIRNFYRNRKDVFIKTDWSPIKDDMYIYTNQPLFEATEMDINTLLSDKNKNHAYISVDLSYRGDFFTLVDIKEEVVDNGFWDWFQTPEKFYILELSNGKKWITSQKKKDWENPWEVGSSIIVIGTKEKPILINVDVQEGSEININQNACQEFFEYPRTEDGDIWHPT